MKIKFEPRDIWIGLYWCKTFELKFEHNNKEISARWTQFYITFYICLIPLFPVIFRIPTSKTWKSQY